MSREIAYRVLRRVDDDDAYSHIALSTALEEGEIFAADRGLTTEIVYGTLTWRRALDAILDPVVRRGVRSLDADVLTILRIGTYQLHFLDRIPPHAAVDETVSLAHRHTRGASGLVNAVLRNVADLDQPRWWSDQDRERKPSRYLGERYSLPNWLANRMIQQEGLERAETLAEAYTRRPPLYVRRLGDGEPPPEADPIDDVPNGFRVAAMTDPVRAGIADGDWTVQDLGSQLVGHYCGPPETGRILDGCAGLGGKALHLAALSPSARITALDPNASKLKMLEDAAETQGVSERVETVHGELETFARRSEEPFDLVLVDAPCTGLGTMRRHPETRWRRRQADITIMASLQEELLEAAKVLVRPGGLLVYSVCTFTREETTKQAEIFLERHPEFRRESVDGGPVEWPRFETGAGAFRTNPADHDCDGFYGVRLRREG